MDHKFAIREQCLEKKYHFVIVFNVDITQSPVFYSISDQEKLNEI